MTYSKDADDLARDVAELAERGTIIEAESLTPEESLTVHESILDALAAVRIVARHHGYTVAWHGSMSRDIDLIAVPWREIVSEPADLAAAVITRVGGYIRLPDRALLPQKKPHGRLAWSIHLLGVGTYIDLSVMPPLRAAEIVP